MQALRSSKGVGGEGLNDNVRDDVHDNKERERSVTFKEDREDALEPAWLKRNSISNSSTLETPSQPRVFPASQYKYSKEQLLELYKPSAQLPASFATYPIITSEEVLIPVALLPPELQDEVMLCVYFSSKIII